jgi:DNA-binding transcriptional regulator YiaG
MDKSANQPVGAVGSSTAGPIAQQSIREFRTRIGLTQEEFAHAIAVTVSTVNRWENGHAKPSKLAWRAMQALARRHGVPLAERRPHE